MRGRFLSGGITLHSRSHAADIAPKTLIVEIEFVPLAVLAAASLFAGFIDAVVGGGGLIQVPALFTILPRELPATLFGTNKIASVFGTANAAIGYARRVRMPWRTVLPATAAAFVFSFLGALSVAWLPREVLRPTILILLIVAAAYTFWRKEFGVVHAPRHDGRTETLLAFGIGALAGFYDGFFGPGMGSFLILLLIRVFGFDFLHASAVAKIVNVATNVAAISYFAPNGYFIAAGALVMAIGNVSGSFFGTRMALRHGSAFVRKAFLLVVCALIVKFAWDTFAA